MKNIFLISFIVIASFLSSCDELKDKADVNFNTTISNSFAVSITEPNTTYDGSATINLNNEDTNEYLDKLKDIEIKKMTYKISDYTGDPIGEITGVLKADGITLHSVSDLVVKNASDGATVFEVTDTAALNDVATALLENKIITVQATGTADYDVSMFFVVTVTLDLGVKANPL